MSKRTTSRRHDTGEEQRAASSAGMVRDASGLITYVEDSMVDVLGWRPDELIGHPSTEFIHPEDQPSAIAAWWAMIGSPSAGGVWVGRYRGSDGSWKWVQSVNVNHLDDPDNPVVQSTMSRVSGEQVSFEEQLQARKQTLSRLSDALPVGVFEIDVNTHLTFTNDRLQAVLGCPAAAMAAAQFSTVVEADRPLIDAALLDALDDKRVGDVEIRLEPQIGDPDDPDGEGRVCVLSLRTLTTTMGVVTGVIGCVADVTDSVRLRRYFQDRASVDELTRCLNRATTLELLSSAAADVDQGHGIGVVFIDLDRFKPVNDRFGHAAGDRVLQAAARRLSAAVRDGDRVGRVGGDEFLVVCPDVASADEAFEIAERLSRALRATIDVGAGAVDMRASVGVAWTADHLDADTLVARADTAMYRAKRVGSPAAELYTPGLDDTVPRVAS